jgi:transcriptional regulator with XRE-family HTH domain
MSTHYREIYRAERAVEEAEHAVGCAAVKLRETQTALGAALRACREAKGVSLREVAKAVGLSAPFISDCELGRRNLSPHHRTTYLKFLRPLLAIKLPGRIHRMKRVALHRLTDEQKADVERISRAEKPIDNPSFGPS